MDVVSYLGSADFMQRNFAKAQERCQQVLAIARETGDRRRECMIFIGMTNISQNQGDLLAAAESLRSALALSRNLNDRALEAKAFLYGGQQAWLGGDLAAAKESYELSLSTVRAIGARVAEAPPLRGLAKVAVARGEFDSARTLYLDPYMASKEHGDPGYLDEIARMAIALSSPEDATRIAGGADALRQAFGLKVWPIQRERVQGIASDAKISWVRRATTRSTKLGEPSIPTASSA